MQKILFYSLDAAPLFDESIKTPIGGAEIRAFNFAKYLARNTYQVYIIVAELTNKKIIKENVTIKPVNYFSKKQSFLSRIQLKLLYLLKYRSKVMYRDFLKYSEFFLIKPRYICLFGITGNTYNAAKISKQVNSELVLFIASDEEINFQNTSSDKTKLSTSFNEVQDFLKIPRIIFVQNNYQKKMLADLFKIDAHLLLNPIDLNAKLSGVFTDYILWVGKSSSYKNPKLFKTLAGHFKNQNFLMICNKADLVLFEEIKKDLSANCLLIEHIAPEEIESYFHKCKIFINTSDFEGFPNTFLQASKYGKPIISYNVNPNNFITENNCGTFCHGNDEELIHAVDELLQNTELYNLKSQNALLNVEKHDIEKVGKVLTEALENYSIG